MFVSLFGVIALQAYWLKKNIDQAANEFDQRAERALYASVRNLAKSEMEVVIEEEFGNLINIKGLLTDSLSGTSWRREIKTKKDTAVSVEVIVNGDAKIIHKNLESLELGKKQLEKALAEMEVLEMLADFPLTPFMQVEINQLTSFNTAEAAPAFSLN